MQQTKKIDSVSFSKGIFELSFAIRQKESSFKLHLGSGFFDGEDINDLQSTGISFSGENGQIFDSSGNFFGGYYPSKVFGLDVHIKNEYKYSYFFNSLLISNDMDIESDYINAIKFESEDGDSLSLGIKK